MKRNEQVDEKYWIAINGPGVAISALPMRHPKVTPTPGQLLGFPSFEEAQRAQHLCLTAPMDEVVKFFESLRPDVAAGRVRAINPPHPQPATPDTTVAWTESDIAHQSVQRVFIKTTSH